MRVFDIGTRSSRMDTQKLAEFWTEEGVDYNKVDDSLEVESVPLPFPDQLPPACPDNLADHFTVTIDKETIYHSAARGLYKPPQEPMSKKAKLEAIIADAVLNNEEALELDLYKVTYALSLIKSEKFTL